MQPPSQGAAFDQPDLEGRPVPDGRMSKPWREALKRRMPAVVSMARLVRLTRNQVRFPLVSSYLDWHRRIMGGPFQSMRYSHSGIVLMSELLGTYEQCLVPWIETIIRRQPPLIVDVGAAYGYYAVGLAVTCPTSQVIAYEMDPTRLAVIERCRQANRVPSHRLSLRGEAGIADLAADFDGIDGGFLLMDVEGVEDVLLRPNLIPGLRRTEIIVELHENIVPGITERLFQRFADTHNGTVILQTPVTKQVLKVPRWIDRRIDEYWPKLSTEAREQEMAWMHLTPQT